MENSIEDIKDIVYWLMFIPTGLCFCWSLIKVIMEG